MATARVIFIRAVLLGEANNLGATMPERRVTNEDLSVEIHAVRQEQRELNELISGGVDPEKGLILKVDRIQQSLVPNLAPRVDRLEEAERQRVAREEGQRTQRSNRDLVILGALVTSALSAVGAISLAIWEFATRR